MNKIAVTIAASCALLVGPVAFAAAQVEGAPLRPHASATPSDASESPEPSESVEPTESVEPSESVEPTESETPEAADAATASADHTFTHGLPGALAGSATPGHDFGQYVSGINRTGAPGAVASVMGKGKSHR